MALAGEVLSGQLAAKSLPEAKAVDHIVKMVEDAIELTGTLARGLQPFKLEEEGFTDALRELAAHITEAFKIPCAFECEEPVAIRDPVVATHLYRIAQEAITNAVKHSKGRGIVLSLATDGGLTLTVRDDGIGLPDNPPNSKGMGLRTMAYRASVISAAFNIERLPSCGTRVTCKLPEGGIASKTHDTKS